MNTEAQQYLKKENELQNLRPKSGDNFWYQGEVTINAAPGRVMQGYVYCCEACKKTHCYFYEYYGTPMNPSLPEKWRQVGNVTYCPDHQITKHVFIDGKEVRSSL